MMPPIPNDFNRNVFLIATIVYKYERIDAIRLNKMIQQRSNWSRSEAFIVISDAVNSGIIRYKKPEKMLVLDEQKYLEFKDVFIDIFYHYSNIAMSAKWPLKRTRTTLTDREKMILEKYVKKGRLADVAKQKSGD